MELHPPIVVSVYIYIYCIFSNLLFQKWLFGTFLQELRERIQPYFLRRMKSEVFNEDNDQAATKLSKKNDIIVWLKLTSCQVRSIIYQFSS